MLSTCTIEISVEGAKIFSRAAQKANTNETEHETVLPSERNI